MNALTLSPNFKCATIRTMIFLTAMTFLANLTYANHISPTISAKFESQAKNIIIELDHVNSYGVNISIQDLEGITLFAENYNEPGYFIKKFNLKNLPNGQYEIIIRDEEAILTQTISIYNKHIETDQIAQIFAPTFEYLQEEKSLKLNWTANADYSFNIYDRMGNMVYHESSENKGSIKKTFQMEALPVGEYTAILDTDWESFNKEFTIN